MLKIGKHIGKSHLGKGYLSVGVHTILYYGYGCIIVQLCDGYGLTIHCLSTLSIDPLMEMGWA